MTQGNAASTRYDRSLPKNTKITTRLATAVVAGRRTNTNVAATARTAGQVELK
jgi:hypothetical protein